MNAKYQFFIWRGKSGGGGGREGRGEVEGDGYRTEDKIWCVSLEGKEWGGGGGRGEGGMVIGCVEGKSKRGMVCFPWLPHTVQIMHKQNKMINLSGTQQNRTIAGSFSSKAFFSCLGYIRDITLLGGAYTQMVSVYVTQDSTTYVHVVETFDAQWNYEI